MEFQILINQFDERIQNQFSTGTNILFFFYLQLQFAKKYDSEIEERYRMKIYMDNKHKIHEHNKEYQQGTVSFKMEMNHFGDLVNPAFRAFWEIFSNLLVYFPKHGL